MVQIRPLGGGLFRRPVATRPFAPLHYLLFHAVGFTSAEPPTQGHAQPWIVDARTWEGQSLPGFTFNVTRLTVTWPNAPLRFERQLLPEWYVEDKPVIVAGGATPADYRRLADAYDALIRFSELLGTRRGPRPYDRDQERRDIYQKIANRLYAHKPVSRVALANDFALEPSSFDDKRTRCGLTLDELVDLTLDQLRAMGINPETDPTRP